MKRLRMQQLEAPNFTVRRKSDRRVIVGAIAGDAAVVDGERVVVADFCAEHSPRGFVCLTHSQRLANQHQLQEHVTTSGAEVQHVIACVCAHHGAEQYRL